MPPVLADLLDELRYRGHQLAIYEVLDDSFFVIVLNGAGQRIGTVEYRSPLDEPAEYARGLSYGSDLDLERMPDRALAIVQTVLL